MRALLAIAAAVLAVAGCAPAQPRQEALVAATATSSPAEPVTPSTPERTRAEAAFLAVIAKDFADTLEEGEKIAEEAFLEDGREICEQAVDSPWEAVQAVIDHQEVDAITYQAALTKLCPKHRRIWQAGSTGVGDGEHTVGGEDGIKPGTYRTFLRPVTDCYWERSASNGRIIDNQLVTNAPRGLTVTVRAGEGFTSRDCGPWVRA
ncbi:hypothetical protein [Nonomuraea dietziae]|uniref:hypothetical protein n=1 Tax=Nonomuraea dietziae TaxID=65515 RepID=UPI0033C59A7C